MAIRKVKVGLEELNGNVNPWKIASIILFILIIILAVNIIIENENNPIMKAGNMTIRTDTFNQLRQAMDKPGNYELVNMETGQRIKVQVKPKQ